ncbi:MAG: hypothetical protein ABII22_06495 [Candidatus Micrarchaeota archaeon]
MSRQLPPWNEERENALAMIRKRNWKALENMLKSSEENPKNGAIFALWQRVQEKKDITHAIPALFSMLKEDSGMVAKVIDYHYINKKDKKKFAEMLDDKEINKPIISALWTISLEFNEGLSFIEDLLVAKLKGYDHAIRSYAATDLAYHYSNRKKYDKLIEFLKSNDREIRESAEVVLDGDAQFKDKKTAQKILEAIEKAGINKKNPEIKEIIRKCSENKG